jgi:hypothetical protein
MRARWLSVLLLLSVPAAARGRKVSLPGPEVTLERALGAPATGYEATGRVQIFPKGMKAKSIGFSLLALPDGEFRKEFKKKKKAGAVVVLDDGTRRATLIESARLRWTGPARRESARELAEKLRSLYDIEITTGGRVAKRPTWRLNLKANGVVVRSLWADREFGIVMKSELYRPDGTLSRRERLTRWVVATPTQNAFAPPAADGWTSLPENVPPGLGGGVTPPRWIPEDYFPLSAREVSGAWVLEYGDGLESLTVTLGAGKTTVNGARTEEERLRILESSR